MKNIIFYLGIISCLFITTTTAPFFGISQVGTASYFFFIFYIFLENIFSKDNLLKYINEEEKLLLLLCLLISIYKVIEMNYDTIRSLLFFITIPLFIGIIIRRNNVKVINNVKKIIIIFFIVECSLAIYERVFNINLFPYKVDIENVYIQIESWEFRSTSLLGHPLMNALGVSIILSFILTSNYSDIFKIFSLFFGFIAILCFNARGATLVWSVLGTLFVYSLYRKYKTNIIKRLLVLFLFIFPFIYCIYFLLFNTTLGGRLVNNDKLIDGSAMTRLNVLNSFDYLNDYDLWFGNLSNYLIITRYLGAAGVENSYIVLIIYYGIIFGIPLILSLFLYVRKQLSYFSLFNKILILFSFVIIGSFNNSLSASTPWVLFIICSQCYTYNKSDIY